MTEGISATISNQEIKDLKRAIAGAGKAAEQETAKKLKVAGAIVADEIRRRTPVHGAYTTKLKSGARRTTLMKGDKSVRKSHKPGLLRDSTKVRATRLSAKIVNTALAYSPKYSKGYRYGKRLEFDPKYRGRYAFFYPGFEAKKGEAMAAFDTVLEEVVKAYGG